MHSEESSSDKPLDFIRQIIADDLRSGKHAQPVTRFPPEPNGFLHIGHAKSICLNFGIGVENNSPCHMRFDDTNPSKEETAYVESIKRDVQWLGFTWDDKLFFASDYFDQLYEYAIQLITLGKAYVCQLTADEIRAYRGTLTEPGQESPYRNRSIAENLTLFEAMRAGKFAEGSHVLRAKIDMGSPNVNMRDPVIYRILYARHHRTGDKWCIYPLYDYTHCISDAIEGITHSLCTLEFEDHRPLYDWVLDTLQTPCHPRQIEFARLNLTYTVMSKRKLLQLVTEKYVDGWDDPRMLTISGLRRRGYTPSAIRSFCQTIGIGKRESWIEMSILEDSIRADLNPVAPRLMCVLDPVKVIIDNYPSHQQEMLSAQNHPQDPLQGSRDIPFAREIYIERADFMAEPSRKFHRLAPGKEVRLRYAYIIMCTSFTTDPLSGKITEIHCTYDPQSKSGGESEQRKVKGTIHWVASHSSFPCQVYLYDRLFSVPDPEADKDKDFKEHLNPKSRVLVDQAYGEPAVQKVQAGEQVQFERNGYFSPDPVLSTPGNPVFNRIVTLRDSWAKAQ